jgi:RING-variant domain
VFRIHLLPHCRKVRSINSDNMSVAVAIDKDNNDIINDDDDDTTINFQVAVKVKQGIGGDDDDDDAVVDENNGGEVGNESQTNNACPTTETNNNLLPKFSIICRICHTNDVPERLGLSAFCCPGDNINDLWFSTKRICFISFCVFSFPPFRFRLISPCRCKGTLAFVHKSCLEHWLRESANQHCELCQQRYPLRQSLRYKWWEALLIWYRNPRNRNILQVRSG